MFPPAIVLDLDTVGFAGALRALYSLEFLDAGLCHLVPGPSDHYPRKSHFSRMTPAANWKLPKCVLTNPRIITAKQAWFELWSCNFVRLSRRPWAYSAMPQCAQPDTTPMECNITGEQ